jgi:hypothetical protein
VIPDVSLQTSIPLNQNFTSPPHPPQIKSQLRFVALHQTQKNRGREEQRTLPRGGQKRGPDFPMFQVKVLHLNAPSRNVPSVHSSSASLNIFKLSK